MSLQTLVELSEAVFGLSTAERCRLMGCVHKHEPKANQDYINFIGWAMRKGSASHSLHYRRGPGGKLPGREGTDCPV